MRDELTRQLFTLIKKPEAAQRRVLIDACIALAALVGTKRTGDEMLPLCWEQIGDKHFERRVLVAETCAALAPYIEACVKAKELRPRNDLDFFFPLLSLGTIAIFSAVVDSCSAC